MTEPSLWDWLPGELHEKISWYAFWAERQEHKEKMRIPLLCIDVKCRSDGKPFVLPAVAWSWTGEYIGRHIGKPPEGGSCPICHDQAPNKELFITPISTTYMPWNVTHRTGSIHWHRTCWEGLLEERRLVAEGGPSLWDWLPGELQQKILWHAFWAESLAYRDRMRRVHERLLLHDDLHIPTHAWSWNLPRKFYKGRHVPHHGEWLSCPICKKLMVISNPNHHHTKVDHWFVLWHTACWEGLLEERRLVAEGGSSNSKDVVFVDGVL